MSTATYTPAVPPVAPQPAKVVLEMTLEEAQTILDITEMIGGCPRTTRRGHTDSIGKALRAACVPSTPRDADTACYPADVDPAAAIYFKAAI